MPRADALHGFNIGQRDRLAAARVVGHGQHHQRNAVRAFRADQRFQRFDVEVAFEIQAGLRVGGLGYGQIDRPRAGEFDIRARGVEVRIRRNDLARLAGHREQDALGRAALVRRNHVPEAGQIVHHPLQPEEAFAAGVGLVAAHHRRPLLRGHGAGAGIGEQIDQDIARFDEEQVVAGTGQETLALIRRRIVERLDALDAEGLDDGLHLDYYFIGSRAPCLRASRRWHAAPPGRPASGFRSPPPGRLPARPSSHPPTRRARRGRGPRKCVPMW